MGERKKPKKYGKMNYQQKEVYVQNELKKLGGEGVYYTDDGSRGSHGHGMFDLEKSQEQLKRLASNDYDRRESLKYGVESGDKRFAGLDAGSGFNSMESLVNTDRAIAKYGINVLGNNKMKEKDGDYASVSNALFNKSRNNLTDSMTANEQQKEAENGAVVPISDQLQQDRDTVEEIDNKDYDIFNKNINSGDNQNQRDQATQAFLGKFKLNLKKDMKPNLPV